MMARVQWMHDGSIHTGVIMNKEWISTQKARPLNLIAPAFYLEVIDPETLAHHMMHWEAVALDGPMVIH